MRKAAIFLSGLLLSAHLILINAHSVNFPNADDFHTILLPLNKIVNSQTWNAALAAIFEPHTQHYQVLLRAAAYLSMLLQGAINFRMLIFLGSLWMLPWIFKERRDPTRLLIFSFILCQPLYSEPTLWATNAIPYLWVNSFALLAFSSSAVLSSCFSIMAVLSWGNGIFVPLTIICSKFRKSANWLGQLPAFGLGLLLHLRNPATAGAHSTDIYAICKYFFELLGSAVGYYQQNIALAGGMLIALITLVILLKRYKANRELEPDSMTIIFLLLSLLSCAWFRSDNPDSSFTTSRYTLQSALLIYLIVGALITANRMKIALLILSAFFMLNSYFRYFGYYQLRQNVVEAAALRWQLFRTDAFCAGCAEYDRILAEAEQLGVFSPAPRIFNIAQVQTAVSSALPAQLENQNEYLLSNQQHIFASGYAFRRHIDNWSAKYFLLLKNGEQRLAYPCEIRQRLDVRLHLGQISDLTYSGYQCLLSNPWPQGEFDMFLIASDGEGFWYDLLGHYPQVSRVVR